MKKLLCAMVTFAIAAAAWAAENGKAEVRSKIFGKLEVQWYLEELTSGFHKPETFRKLSAKDAGVRITLKRVPLTENAEEFRFEMTNISKKPVFVRPVAKVKVPMKRFRFWNGYWNPNAIKYDPTDNILSTFFPAIGAYSDGKAVILGVRPTDYYSRLDPGLADRKELSLGFPSYLDPGEKFTYSFVAAAAPGRYGFRDIVQAWYDLFEKDWLPKPDIHPGTISNEAGYLFWNRFHKGMPKYPAEMVRRATGGTACWEWIYAPCIRGGDWDITEELTVGFKNYTKKHVENRIKQSLERLAPAEDFNIAPMWYVNVTWMEKSLCLDRWPDLRFRNWVQSRSWGNDTIFGVYCFGSEYTEIFKKSLDRIPKKFPQVRGIAWDSCFGHHIAYPENRGFKATPAKSFYNREPMALSAIGITHLLDYNHKNFNAGYRMANTVNYKELTPFYTATRTDSAVIEGTPMDRFDANRVLRLEAARARLGMKKPMVWHKNLGPRWTPWIPYAELDEQQKLDAYRQVTEDTLFLSYYWGAICRPSHVSVGVEALWNSLPEAISLTRQGWLPSPACDAPADILVARYGEGAGARIALINANFEDKSAQIFFPKEYWNGKNLLLAGERPAQQVTSVLGDRGTRLDVKLPARSVSIIRVAGVTAAGNNLIVKGSKNEIAGRASDYRITVRSDGKMKFNAEFFRPVEKMPAFITIGFSRTKFAPGKNIAVAVDTGSMTIDWQTERHYQGDIVLKGMDPVECFTITKESAAPANLLGLAKTGSLRIAADKKFEKQAKRVADFFNFLMQFEKKIPASPVITGAGEAAQIVLCVDPAAVGKDLIGKGYIDGKTLRIVAAKPEFMKDTVTAVLRAMDGVYPWFGTIANETYEGFVQTGLAGKTLPAAHKPVKYIVKPTMMEIFKQANLQ